MKVYLRKYGHMDLHTSVSSRSAQLMSQEAFKNYIMEFQSFAGLPQTGDLDEETVMMMNRPRCGVKDIVAKSSSTREKRYALQVCAFPFVWTDVDIYVGLSLEGEEVDLQDLPLSEQQQDLCQRR